MDRDDLHTHLEAERALAARLRDYPGQWVAVASHAVVASARTLSGVLEEVDGVGDVDRVLYVPRRELPAFFPAHARAASR